MSEKEKKQTEKTQQQESIEYLRRFFGSVIANFPVGFIPVVKRQQRLNDTGYPEKGYKTCYKHKHFPLPDVGPGQMALCKNYADNQEDNRFHQLEKLKSRYVVYQFNSSQIRTDNKLISS
jgi:hypothetical protein